MDLSSDVTSLGKINWYKSQQIFTVSELDLENLRQYIYWENQKHMVMFPSYKEVRTFDLSLVLTL